MLAVGGVCQCDWGCLFFFSLPTRRKCRVRIVDGNHGTLGHHTKTLGTTRGLGLWYTSSPHPCSPAAIHCPLLEEKEYSRLFFFDISFPNEALFGATASISRSSVSAIKGTAPYHQDFRDRLQCQLLYSSARCDKVSVLKTRWNGAG